MARKRIGEHTGGGKSPSANPVSEKVVPVLPGAVQPKKPPAPVTEYVLKCPYTDSNCNTGVIINGAEIPIEVVKGRARIPAGEDSDQHSRAVSIRDYLIGLGWPDETEYPKVSVTNSRPEYVPISQFVSAEFMHPDASEYEPISAETAVYLEDGTERKLSIRNNAITVTEEAVFHALRKQGWPCVNSKFRKEKQEKSKSGSEFPEPPVTPVGGDQDATE